MTDEARPRVVFDCMVFLQGAARRNGPAARCIELALDGTVELLASAKILAEVADVFSRPEIRRKFPALTNTLVREYLESIVAGATLVESVPDVFQYSRDTDDEPYLNLAIAGSASCLVSRDKDILSLSESNDDAAVQFRTYAPDVKILDPVSLIHRYQSTATERTS